MGKDYYLIIEGDVPAFYRIALNGGFDVVENLNDPQTPVTTAKYLIKTVDEIANGLGLGIIVVHKEQNMLLRERPQRSIILE